ncbi:MAG: pyridoxal phosphate-dependent aminotransferase [Anaerolineales bacterium]
MEFADRVLELEPEGAYQVLSRAQELQAAGRDIIHLEIGQPDTPTFPNISSAGIQAIQDGHTRYTPSAGMNDLRSAIAEYTSKRLNVKIKSSNVVVGPGAKPALFFPTLALVRPGDEVIYPNPGFPTYEAMIRVAGGTPVPVPLSEEDDFSFDLDAFNRLVSRNTRMVVLNSPSNPTGGVMPLSALEHIAKTASDLDFWVLSDEIYSRIVYSSPAPSIASFGGMLERTIICDGFSKTYSMTGWRLGYGIMPEPLAERVNLLLNHSIGCTASFTQVAGLEALLGPQEQVDKIVQEYRRRRDFLVAGLNQIAGMSCRKPQGSFYTFPNIKAFGIPSDQLANYLLEEAGVALLSGTSFGKYGEGYIRLCFANSIENLEIALERLKSALDKL